MVNTWVFFQYFGTLFNYLFIIFNLEHLAIDVEDY